jgi:NAD(P)-dependent dehydrogenase (short-subunit alcohol dehydrogenase family)
MPAFAKDCARYPSLAFQHVVITGGATGIGESLVRHFHAQKSLVSFIDIAYEEGKELEEELGDDCCFYHCDLRDIEALQRVITKSHLTFGPVRVLINNAAKDDRHDVLNFTSQDWDRCQEINLKPHFFTAQAVAVQMAEAGGGSIINISSNSYVLMVGGMPGYLTAKAGIVGLTRGLARDLGVNKIRVNSILPGWVMTKRQEELWLTEEAEEELLASQCLKEKLYPSDVSRLALFLASDDSHMITGQAYTVDGGRT